MLNIAQRRTCTEHHPFGCVVQRAQRAHRARADERAARVVLVTTLDADLGVARHETRLRIGALEDQQLRERARPPPLAAACRRAQAQRRDRHLLKSGWEGGLTCGGAGGCVGRVLRALALAVRHDVTPFDEPPARVRRSCARARLVRVSACTPAARAPAAGTSEVVAVASAAAAALGGAQRACRVQDRAVPGAPAQIAVEVLPYVLFGRVGRVPQQRVERHDDARRAEAALRAVERAHALLHRVQPRAHRADALNRRDLAPVGGAERHQARVHGDAAHGAGYVVVV